MDEITKQIEAMADKVSVDPKEQLFSVIKSLGPAGLKAKLATLSPEEKVMLKSALEEMTLKKAVSFDKEAQSAKMINGKESDTIIQEEIASDDADEKLVKPEAAMHNHQGSPIAGEWEGTVIKGGEAFKKLKNQLSHEKGVTDPAALAAEIGRKKMGKQAFQEKAAEGKKMKKSEIEVMEQHLDEIIEKGMAKCSDSKMLAKKLEEKGMDKHKVQGAIDKFHGKKMREKEEKEEMEKAMKRDEAKEKIMQMEEKEHGTKNPKKLVEDEKKEHAGKKEMKKAGGEDALKEEENPEAKKQDGDAPDLQVGGQNKSGMKKEAAPNIEDNGKASVNAQKEVNNMKVNTMAKSISWEDPNALLKANTQGRNFNFNVEQFITETLSKGEPTQEVRKSQPKEDLNDLIAKSMDRDWNQLTVAAGLEKNKAAQNGKLVKSFEIDDLAASMGISVEEAKKILGE